MLLNPNGALPILPSTHILTEDFGLAGTQFEDPVDTGRIWTIHRLFAPLSSRMLGGIRAKVVDNKGFISFVNQRDLELLLELAKPGAWCPWLGASYPYINDTDDGWIGLCCDSVDLLDELHEHELILRQQYLEHYQCGYVPSGVEYTRKVHKEDKVDYEELLTFLWDKDPETQYGPDGRFETLERRWCSVEHRKVIWDRVL